MRTFCDSHTDFITEFKSFDEKLDYVLKIKKLSAAKICSAVFTTSKKIGIEKLKKFKQEIDLLNQFASNILCFSVEDLGSIESVNLEKLILLSPTSATLTWNYQNQYGGGAKSFTGLTKTGICTCKLLEKNKIWVDTAHMNEKSFKDFYKITSRPIFNSHTNVYSICKNARNLKNHQIHQIIRSNGFVGITFYQKFISKEKISCKDIAMQFAYLAKNFGCDNFGIGSDFFGFDKKYLPINLKSYNELINLEQAMKQMGFTDVEIDKIFSRNFLGILTRYSDTI